MSQTKKNSSEQDVLDQLQKLLETLSNHQKQELINNGTRELETQLLKAQAHLLDNINNNHIFINVGGKVFTTTRKTLSAIPDSKLDKLVTGRAPIMFDESGYFFLDRNPEYFSYVLEFLREGSIAFPQDSSAKKRIIHELNYFDCLVNRSTHWRFDSNAKSFDINLDDQGTTAWNNGYGANSVVFGTDEFIFGVYEWSIEILSSQGNYYMAFGVASKKTAGSNFSAFSYQSCSCITAQGSAFLMKPNAIPGLTKGDIINFTFDADSKKLTAECSKKNLKCEGKVSGDDLYPFFYTYSNPDKVRLLFK